MFSERMKVLLWCYFNSLFWSFFVVEMKPFNFVFRCFKLIKLNFCHDSLIRLSGWEMELRSSVLSMRFVSPCQNNCLLVQIQRGHSIPRVSFSPHMYTGIYCLQHPSSPMVKTWSSSEQSLLLREYLRSSPKAYHQLLKLYCICVRVPVMPASLS